MEWGWEVRRAKPTLPHVAPVIFIHQDRELPMARSPQGVTFICPNCHEVVDPTKPNAMMSAATKQWQHTDCWRASAPVVQPEAPADRSERRGSR